MHLKSATLGSLLLISACSTTGIEPTGTAVSDPFEGFNRSVYAFNEQTDKAILGPAAKGYRSVTTPPIRAGVSNFLTNLNQPVVFTNTILQGKPTAAADTFARFLVNSTVGIAGLFDPATGWSIPEHSEDFGQTLGKWGAQPGPYIMLPFFGPSNLRDSLGIGLDNLVDPINYATFEGDTAFRVARTGVGAISARESLDDVIELVREQPEPYIFLRRNYTQQRAAAIRDGREPEDPFQDLPEFDDYDFGDE